MTDFRLTFGEVLVLISVVSGIAVQYFAFANRLSRFEGYTKAKLELMEQLFQEFFRSFLGHVSTDAKERNKDYYRNGP